MVRRIYGRPRWLIVFAGAVVRACPRLPAAAQTGMRQGQGRRRQGTAGRRTRRSRSSMTERRPQVRDEDRQEGRVHPDRPASRRRTRSTRRKGQASARPTAQRTRAVSAARAELRARRRAAPRPARQQAAKNRRAARRRSTKAWRCSSAGNHDEAIEKFTAGARASIRPATTATTTSAIAYAQKKDYDKAKPRTRSRSS